MSKCIDLLCEAQMFSTLNANSRFWQIKMRYKNVDKTAFVIHHGFIKYSRISYRLKNAL